MSDPRWDPELLAFQQANDAAAAGDPPPDPLLDPLGARRRIEALNLPAAQGGPAMRDSREFWLPLRGRRLFCRLHRPDEGARDVAVLLHGGGWVTNSVDTHDRVARELAAASGWSVLLPDYALSPESRFPVAVEEVAALFAALRAGAVPEVAGGRVVLGGDSAGANLALGAALGLRGADGAVPGLAGLLLFYGVYAAEFDNGSYREFTEGYGLTASRMRGFWDLYAPEAAMRDDPRCAPLRAAGFGGLPPCLLLPAGLDVLRDEGAAMAAALRRDGVAVSEHATPGAPHGFIRAVGRASAADAAVAAAGRWLRGLD